MEKLGKAKWPQSWSLKDLFFGLIFVFGAYFSQQVIAAEVSFEASLMGADSSQITWVEEGEVFLYVMTLKVEEKKSGLRGALSGSSLESYDYVLPNFVNFDVLSETPLSSSQTSIANGEMTSTSIKGLRVALRPKKVGVYTLGAATLEYKLKNQASKFKKSNTLRVEVKKKGLAPKRPAPQQRKRPKSLFDSFFDDDIGSGFGSLVDKFFDRGRSAPRIDERNWAKMPEGQNFFIDVEVSEKDKLYVGQQVTVAWYLYTLGSVTAIDTLKYPSLNGFWKEDIEMATRLNFKEVERDGLWYRRARLASFSLYPLSAGEVELDPYIAKVDFLKRSRSGYSETFRETQQSDTIVLPVLNPPEDFKNSNSTGITGIFTLSMDNKPSQANQFEPISLKLLIEGQGNLRLLKAPKLPLDEKDFELYAVNEETRFSPPNKMQKVFEYIVVPKVSGSFDIEDWFIGFFDPHEASPYELKIDGWNLEVTKKDKSLVKSESFLDGSPDILPAISYLSINSKSLKKNDLKKYFVMFGFWFIGFLVFLFILVKNFFYAQPIKEKSLKERLQPHIDELEGFLEKNENRKSSQKIIQVLSIFVGNETGQKQTTRPLEEILEKSHPSFRKKYGEELLKINQACLTSGYAKEAGKKSQVKFDEEAKALKENWKKLLSLIQTAHSKSI